MAADPRKLFADPEKNLDRSLLIDLVVKCRMEGRSTADTVAMLFGLDTPSNRRQYFDLLDVATHQTYDRLADTCKQAFVIQNARLEELWRLAYARLGLLETFDEGVCRACIAILDRQAKLLGLDKDKDNRGSRKGRFLEPDALPSTICGELERRGITLPDSVKKDAAIKDLIAETNRGKGLEYDE